MPGSLRTTLSEWLLPLAYRVQGFHHLGALSNADLRLLARIRAERLTYLTPAKLGSLLTTCRRVEAEGRPGLFIEAGCALGGSTILLAKAKRPERPLRVYDVFGMIPPPTSEDTPDVFERYRKIVDGKSEGIGGDVYYGYQPNLEDTVRANLLRQGICCEAQSISLIKGRLEDTMHIDQPVAVAHIDVDWYQPVWTSLQRIFPWLVPGGSIILDDYHDWGGCRKAVDQFLAEMGNQVTREDAAGSLTLTRKPG